MIDAHAVVADWETLSGSAVQEQGSAELGLLRRSLQPLAVQESQDAHGNLTLTLPGAAERAVVLGAFVRNHGAASGQDSRVALVVGVETLKALARRFDGRPPCSVQLVVWAGAEPARAGDDRSTLTGLDPAKVAAYLELHTANGAELEEAGTPLGVAGATAGAESGVYHPKLAAMCDEAIQELTGTTNTVASEQAPHADAVAKRGIPAAVMYLQQLASTPEGKLTETSRLHLLQAAEAFGRWAEATVHLATGEEADLWAREHRVPHSAM